MSRRLFIGDVHGHYDGLMNLLDAIAPNADDQLYFVGDLIDRGAQSAKVVDFVRRHATGCVRGNHEQLLMDAFVDGEVHMPRLQGWLYSGGQMTLSSYSTTEQMLADLEWIRTLPLYIDLDTVWLVHAGVDPTLPLAQQSSRELCWIRDSFHYHPQPYFETKLIITGHTMTFTLPGVAIGQIAQGPGWIDIDTGAYHPRSGWLTAVDPDNQQVYQMNVYESRYRYRSWAEAITQITPKRSQRFWPLALAM